MLEVPAPERSGEQKIDLFPREPIVVALDDISFPNPETIRRVGEERGRAEFAKHGDKGTTGPDQRFYLYGMLAGIVENAIKLKQAADAFGFEQSTSAAIARGRFEVAMRGAEKVANQIRKLRSDFLPSAASRSRS